ncbi:MAG: hypothetical protein LC437_05275 [Thiohalomonas sp.]|nr:hypothetical protein [Thiohalomonas sp.]
MIGYNLPEGVTYDYNKGGLSLAPESSDASPYSSNPLDSLKKLQNQESK